MRRPLFGALAGIAAAVWLTLFLFPWDPPDYEPFRKAQVCMTGTVCGLEPRRSGETIVWRLILSDITMEDVRFPDAASAEDAAFSAEKAEKAEMPDTTVFSGKSSADKRSVQGDGTGLSPGKRGRVLCVLEQEPALDMSARVRVRGTVFPFQPAYNEGEFDLRLYNHILHAEYSLREVTILAASASTNPLAATLYHYKKTLSSVIDRNFSIQNSPVLQAMLLGEKGLLEEETKSLFQGAGIIHILSISGLHLSLLGMGLFSLLGKLRLPMPVRAAASVLLLILYGEMVGMGTSAFRAIVMLSLYIIAKVIGRTYDLLTASAIACILLLFEQPLYLLNTGFQFSFGAVLALGILAPALPDGILQIFAIPLGTLPIYLWNYGTFPAWSLLLNLLVIPLMPVVMISGGIVTLAGSLVEITGGSVTAAGSLVEIGGGTVTTAGSLVEIGRGSITAAGSSFPIVRWILFLAGRPAEILLDLFRFLAEISEKLPGHILILGRPSPVQILIYYLFLFAFSAVSVRLQMPGVRRRVEDTAVSGGVYRKKEVGNRHHDLSSGIFGQKGSRRDVSSGIFGQKGSRRDVSSGIFGQKRSSRDVSSRSGREKGGRNFFSLTEIAGSVCLHLGLYDNRARRRFGSLCTALWMVFSVLVLTFRVPPSFEMDFLYVGQGDGICIQSGGRTFLIDGGSTTREELAKYTLKPFLYCKGIRRLDGLILTHEDLDHCSGMIELLEEAAAGTSAITIQNVYLPDIAEESKGEKYRKIESLAGQAGIPVHCLHRGQRIRTGNLTMDCLHPAEGAAYEEPNACSTTLLVQYRDFSALLTGDLDGQGEEDLLEWLSAAANREKGKTGGTEGASGTEGTGETGETGGAEEKGKTRNNHSQGEETAQTWHMDEEDGILYPTILKIAHHGSRNATSERFLQKVIPEIAVISAGINNMYGHPHEELLQRVQNSSSHPVVYRTDQQGEIKVRWKTRVSGWYVQITIHRSVHAPLFQLNNINE